jgi:hypothetical protein
MQRPYLIFDKSSLESLNIIEAVLLDTLFSCVITPIFFVECLADLEKEIRSKSKPEQLVGSPADRTSEYESCAALHHLDVLRWELTGKFGLLRLKGGPFVAGAKSVQLGDQKGVIFRPTKEVEAMQRWTAREFLEAERQVAKAWRKSLTSIGFDGMVKVVMAEIGPHSRKPRTLQDARQMTEPRILSCRAYCFSSESNPHSPPTYNQSVRGECKARNASVPMTGLYANNG